MVLALICNEKNPTKPTNCTSYAHIQTPLLSHTQVFDPPPSPSFLFLSPNTYTQRDRQYSMPRYKQVGAQRNALCVR